MGPPSAARLCACACILAFAGADPVPIDGVLRASPDGSVYAYIPPPKGGNHAAAIEALPDGTLAAAWFTGGEGSPNCSIAISLLAPGAAAWTAGRIAAEVFNASSQNPVLHYEPSTARLMLWHTVQSPSAGESSSAIWLATSGDGGATFSPTQPFYAVPGAFTRNRLVALPGQGGLVFPCYNSTPGAIPDYPIYLISDPSRTAWRAVAGPGLDLIQPTVVRLPAPAPAPEGAFVLRSWLRDENQSAVFRSDSVDGGSSWSEPVPTLLPNNNAAIQAHTLVSGAVAMVFDDQRGPGTPRSPLVIALSDDAGASWPAQRALQVHDDNSTEVGEYSYPSLLQTSDGAIHVLFTYDRVCIKYVRVSEAWVRAGNASGKPSFSRA